MTSVLIQSSTHDYEVIIEEGIRHQIHQILPNHYQRVLIITDEKVAQLYMDDITQALSEYSVVHTAVVPVGEASKGMDQYEYLLDQCVQAQLDRQSLIIALGGGMIGDLAGFVASTYLRGIDFVQVPTTILAHDSSVGGKVAINHAQGKNLIGSFYNPKQVIYDIETIESLSEVEVRSGYGEVIKHAFLSDDGWLQELLSCDLSELSNQQLRADLTKGIRVKSAIVENDERESGIRKHLNLGHTLAHAIEAEVGYGEMTHGEAVAIGILFALQLSNRTLGVDLPVNDYVNWLKRNGYPVKVVTELVPEQILNRMKVDKKTVNDVINYVLLTGAGAPCVEQLTDEKIIQELEHFLKEVIQH